jgi:hypothetical protein
MTINKEDFILVNLLIVIFGNICTVESQLTELGLTETGVNQNGSINIYVYVRKHNRNEAVRRASISQKECVRDLSAMRET